MADEITICKLCLEPVSNFICTDCLHSDVKKWLQLVQRNDLYTKIFTKHNNIKSTLSSDADGNLGNYCIKCKNSVGEIACPPCYLYEMYLILKSVSQELADDFERNFNFDFKFGHGYSQLTLMQSLHNEPISTRSFNPIVVTEDKNLHDMNVCDNCGEASVSISDYNGMLVCESCRDDHNITLFRPFAIDFQ